MDRASFQQATSAAWDSVPTPTQQSIGDWGKCKLASEQLDSADVAAPERATEYPLESAPRIKKSWTNTPLTPSEEQRRKELRDKWYFGLTRNAYDSFQVNASSKRSFTAQDKQTVEPKEAINSGQDPNAEKLLWTRASSGYTYTSIGELIKDIEKSDRRVSTLWIHFPCPLLAGTTPADQKSHPKYEILLEQLLNHVVLIKTSAGNGVEPKWLMKATTCREYMERRWPSIGVQLIEYVARTYKEGYARLTSLFECKYSRTLRI